MPCARPHKHSGTDNRSDSVGRTAVFTTGRGVWGHEDFFAAHLKLKPIRGRF